MKNNQKHRTNETYATRLYELLLKSHKKGFVLKTINELRELFAVGDRFKSHTNFRKGTFERACREINVNYNMGLYFDELKQGKRFTAVRFFFRKTKVLNRVDQSGNMYNVYDKPSLKISKIRKNQKQDNKQNELLEEPLLFKKSALENKIKDTIKQKLISSIIKSFVQNFVSRRKNKK